MAKIKRVMKVALFSCALVFVVMAVAPPIPVMAMEES